MQRNLNLDILWNLVSYVIMGASGILLNTLIGFKYSPETLGVFNQVFAFYIIISQLSVFGIHYSAIKYIPHTDEPQERAAAIWASSLLTFLTALLVCLALYLATPRLSHFFSQEVIKGIQVSIPGLFLFSLNKTQLSVINGLRFMKLFAIVQALRPSGMLIALAYIVFTDIHANYVPLVISIPEFIISPLLLFYIFKNTSRPNWATLKPWLLSHLHFGSKSFLSGTIIELNSKVDILMLGLFFNDKIVGIYSLASLIGEGLLQLPVVIRNNINPLLSKYWANKNIAELHLLIKKWKVKTYVAMGSLTLIACLAYPIYVEYFIGNSTYLKSWGPLAILMVGIFISSGYFPFNMLIIQTGQPFRHSLYIGSIVLVNIIMNALLIPQLSYYGAAIATSLSLVYSAVALAIYSRLHLKVQL